jgi:hypothetical protein
MCVGGFKERHIEQGRHLPAALCKALHYRDCAFVSKTAIALFAETLENLLQNLTQLILESRSYTLNSAAETKGQISSIQFRTYLFLTVNTHNYSFILYEYFRCLYWSHFGVFRVDRLIIRNCVNSVYTVNIYC